jgi:hypothetical protein
VHLRLFGGDQTFTEQKLNVAVIPRSRHDGTLPHVIQPAVAHMRPPRRTLLYDTNGTGSAWPMFDGKIGPELDDLFMGSTQSKVQKAHRIEHGLWRVPERFEDDLLRHLGRPRAISMPAHAVNDDEQG